MLFAASILFFLTVKVAGHTIYWVIYSIPGFSALRAISRVILVLLLPLAALLGMLLDDLTARGRSRAIRCMLASVLSVFLIVECSLVTLGASAPRAWSEHLEVLEAQLPKDLPPGAVLAVRSDPKSSAAWPGPWMLDQVDAQLAAVMHGIATMNGYSSNFPPTWREMSTCSDVDHNIRAGRHFLAEHGLPHPEIAPRQLILLGFGPAAWPGLVASPTLKLGRTYHFALDGEGNDFVGNGFSVPESWGRWTEGRNAFLFFALESAPLRPVSISVDASPFSPAADRGKK
jgi:hypothetical protein